MSGGRGTGKTTTLYNIENKGIGDETQYIFTKFDSFAMSHVGKDENFNERFFNHYYELILSHKILNYIKKYYGLTYENNFKELKGLLNRISDDTNYFINNICFEKKSLNRYLKLTEYSHVILEQLKKNLNIRSIYLAIDRFDWTNSNSSLSQKILSNFFDMFDKMIITTDDDTLQNNGNRNSFLEKGYSFVDANYGKDKLVIKEIIRKRIQDYNKNINNGKSFPKEIITEQIYQDLITKTIGNISIISDSVREVIIMWNWKDIDIDLQKEFNVACNNQINSSNKIKKMSKSPKLYL